MRMMVKHTRTASREFGLCFTSNPGLLLKTLPSQLPAHTIRNLIASVSISLVLSDFCRQPSHVHCDRLVRRIVYRDASPCRRSLRSLRERSCQSKQKFKATRCLVFSFFFFPHFPPRHIPSSRSRHGENFFPHNTDLQHAGGNRSSNTKHDWLLYAAPCRGWPCEGLSSCKMCTNVLVILLQTFGSRYRNLFRHHGFAGAPDGPRSETAVTRRPDCPKGYRQMHYSRIPSLTGTGTGPATVKAAFCRPTTSP